MTRFAYIDGSNNTFEIGDRLNYIPITKAQSSSGMYSGGAPKSVAIDVDQRAALIALLDRIAGDRANVLAQRPMGCGTVIRGDERTYTSASSPLKAELERTLRDLLGRAG